MSGNTKYWLRYGAMGNFSNTACGVNIGAISLESHLTLSRRVKDKKFQCGQAFVHMHKDPRV